MEQGGGHRKEREEDERARERGPLIASMNALDQASVIRAAEDATIKENIGPYAWRERDKDRDRTEEGIKD